MHLGRWGRVTYKEDIWCAGWEVRKSDQLAFTTSYNHFSTQYLHQHQQPQQHNTSSHLKELANMAARAVLITGATGKQGSSVVNALLRANADFEILALTRNASSPSAQSLAKKSPLIKLVTGNLDDPSSIFATARSVTKTPIWGVFSVQTPFGGKANTKTEERQGKALVDASLANGVSHFVYSSVDRGGDAKSAKDPTNVPHFISKHNIEQHLFAKAKGSDMTWTVLRPVAFMENLVPGFLGKVFNTDWKMVLRPEQKLQLIATVSIPTPSFLQ